MAVKKVAQTGHLGLKAKNEKIAFFSSPELKKLIKDLKDTMCNNDLIGIAAPQIAVNLTVFATYNRNTKIRKSSMDDELRIYINPKITFMSEEKATIYEGCGSVANGNLFGPVLRPKEIKIEAFNVKGDKFSLLCDGILARVIQHEYDHLEGIEFTEKISDYRKLLDKVFYLKNIKNSKEQKEASKITKIEYKPL